MLVEGGCLCCAVSGAVVDALRDLFMLALRRQIAISPRAHRDQRPGRPGARVVHAEARSLPGRALCLSRRHRGRGCAAWRGQLADQPEQPVSWPWRTPSCSARPTWQRMPRCRPCNGRSRPSIGCKALRAAPGLATGRGAGGLAGCRDAAGGAVELVAGVRAAGGGQAWHGVQLQPDTGCTHWSRGLPGGHLAGPGAVWARPVAPEGAGLFRRRDAALRGARRAWRAVSLRTLPQWPSDERASRLVCILRGPDAAEVQACLRRALGQLPA